MVESRDRGGGVKRFCQSSQRGAPQCDDTNLAPGWAGGMSKLAFIRFASAAGVRPNRRLNSRLNYEVLS